MCFATNLEQRKTERDSMCVIPQASGVGRLQRERYTMSHYVLRQMKASKHGTTCSLETISTLHPYGIVSISTPYTFLNLVVCSLRSLPISQALPLLSQLGSWERHSS